MAATVTVVGATGTQELQTKVGTMIGGAGSGPAHGVATTMAAPPLLPSQVGGGLLCFRGRSAWRKVTGVGSLEFVVPACLLPVLRLIGLLPTILMPRLGSTQALSRST